MKAPELYSKLHPSHNVVPPMDRRLNRLSPILLWCVPWVSLLVACSTTQPSGKNATKGLTSTGDPNSLSHITPSEALAIARQFSEHSWTPFAHNILHAKDESGVIVNTPDITLKEPPDRPGWWIPGEVNRGVPYQWGGFDSTASFSSKVAQGLAAGDVSSPAKRRADNAAISHHAAGVDCSGLVSRCLKLPTVHDTAKLPSVCEKLESANDLRPGDLLNIPRGHVLLCAGWARPDRSWIYFYDTGSPPDYWRPSLKEAPLEKILALGYTPLRYRGMAYEPEVSGKEVLTRSVRRKVLTVPEPVVGEP